MSTCNPVIDSFQRADSKLDVSEKYLQLMQDSLSGDSLYTRAKETFSVVFKDRELTETQKAQLTTEYIATMSVNLSSAAMQTALAWAKEERDGGYTLAKLKADAEVTLAQKEKVTREICLVDKQIDVQCANITATLAGSIRDNGKVAVYDADGCVPLTLEASGLKYEQTKQVQAATYQVLSDAYRKSGKVQIGIDGTDDYLKGLSGDDKGYTNQQIKNAERQRQAYEDSKVNHLLNSVAVVTGQMLSAEVDADAELVDMMKAGMRKLLSPNSETPTPFLPYVG
jgi:hypothetical protein